MKETTNYLTWNNFLSAQRCAEIIDQYYQQDAAKSALVADSNNPMLSFRKTEVCWIPSTDEISLQLFNKALIANTKAGWGFDIDNSEKTQIAKYEVGGHYEWHADEAFYHRFRGWHRKVSTVVFLSDPSTYTGGEFLFDTVSGPLKIEAEMGTVICFPSEVRHKVAPVTSGVRYSLVSWATGPLMF